MDDSIPKFLRWNPEQFKHGLIPRRLTERDCLIIISEIWNDREQELQKFAKKIDLEEGEFPSILKSSNKQNKCLIRSFDECVSQYFEKNYGTEQLRLEWSHGFYETLDYLSFEHDLIEMKQIIDNELDEACHWQMVMQLKRVEDCLAQHATVHSISTTSNANIGKEILRDGKMLMPMIKLKEALISLLKIDETLENYDDPATIFGQLIVCAKKAMNVTLASKETESLIASNDVDLISEHDQDETAISDQDNVNEASDNVDKDVKDGNFPDLLINISELFQKEIYPPKLSEFQQILVKQFEIKKLQMVDIMTNKFRETKPESDSIDMSHVESTMADMIKLFGPQEANEKLISTISSSMQEHALSASFYKTIKEYSCEWLFKIDYKDWPECMATESSLEDILKRLMGSNLRFHF